MIAGRRILARQHDIARRRRIGGNLGRRRMGIDGIGQGGPAEWPRPCHCRLHVDPPGMGHARRDVLRAHGVRQGATGAGIDRAFRAMRRGQARLDIGAGAEAGIEQVHRPQLVERRVIIGQALRLEDDFPIPCHAQPAQILDDPVDMFGPAAGAVDILDPQAKGAARGPCQVHRHQRRPAMADMQSTGGAWRETTHKMLWCGGLSHTGS